MIRIMALPLWLLGAAALGGGYLLLKPHPTLANPFPDGNRPGPVPVPIPPPNPDGSPPANAVRLPGVDIVADLSKAVPGRTGQVVPVTWVYLSGPNAGDGGGSDIPLAWVAADKSAAAVVWNVDPAYFLGDNTFAPGAIYMARAKA